MLTLKLQTLCLGLAPYYYMFISVTGNLRSSREGRIDCPYSWCIFLCIEVIEKVRLANNDSHHTAIIAEKEAASGSKNGQENIENESHRYGSASCSGKITSTHRSSCCGKLTTEEHLENRPGVDRY